MKHIPNYKPHESDDIRTRLVHAVTRYDRQQAMRSKSYSMYALGIYLGAVTQVLDETAEGNPLRVSLVRNFNGRLLDVVLKACGLPKSTREEQR